MDGERKSMSSGQGPLVTTEEPETTPSEEPARSEAEEVIREECEELLARKEEEVKQLQDRILRLAADMDNTRKRIEREKSESICFANESMLRDLLPVADNLERAIQHSEQKADFGSLLEGVRMTLKGFSDVLAKYGCVPFDTEGQAFDPRFHEAMLQQESTAPENSVIQEIQKGYKLYDRLLRPALVILAKSPDNGSKKD